MEGSGIDMQAITAVVVSFGIRIVTALAILVVGWIVIKWIRSAMTKQLLKTGLDETLIPFLTKLVYYILLAGLVIAVLGRFGVQMGAFIAVLGAAGLAVGLALQGTLSNFAAGVMLLIFRPFRVGDFIDAGGTTGTVQEIGVFSSTLHSPDNVRIIVPNSVVYGQTIKNFSFNDTRRNDMVFGVSYDDDLGKVHDIISRVVGADERVLKDPEPVIAVSELADSSVNFVVRPWCKKEDYWGLRFDLMRKLKEELEAQGCSIPFPQSDVHMHEVKGSAA